jgi:hypothetical protein
MASPKQHLVAAAERVGWWHVRDADLDLLQVLEQSAGDRPQGLADQPVEVHDTGRAVSVARPAAGIRGPRPVAPMTIIHAREGTRRMQRLSGRRPPARNHNTRLGARGLPKNP